ncbi:unnamed protein product [Spirodela intermedia]|uniref:Uncharacterized protein n=1 Tax=Spirodela intermedia TaxID=51605 RepID=A0ABN7E8Q5_SPIIN|nr:unnamed protein product [Spirodela intermedia]
MEVGRMSRASSLSLHSKRRHFIISEDLEIIHIIHVQGELLRLYINGLP